MPRARIRMRIPRYLFMVWSLEMKAVDKIAYG